MAEDRLPAKLDEITMAIKTKPGFQSEPQQSVDLGEIDLSAIVKRSAQALRKNRPTAGLPSGTSPQSKEPTATRQGKIHGRREHANRSETSSIESVYAKALSYAAGRELSAKRMAQKLDQKGFDQTLIQPTLARLKQEKVVDDARFAELKTHSLVQRGKGRQAIRAALSENGIDSALIQATLASSETDWVEVAARTRLKKFGDRVFLDAKDYAKQSRFLAQRGFDPDVIRKVLSKVQKPS